MDEDAGASSPSAGGDDKPRTRGVARCEICQDTEEDDNWVVLPCGHPFHLACQRKWADSQLGSKQQCAKCRHGLGRSKPFKLFLDNEVDAANCPKAALQQKANEFRKQAKDLEHKCIKFQQSNDALVQELQAEDKKHKKAVLKADERQRALEAEKEKLQQELDRAKAKHKDMMQQHQAAWNEQTAHKRKLEETIFTLETKLQRMQGHIQANKIDAFTAKDNDVDQFIGQHGDDKENLTTALKRCFKDCKEAQNHYKELKVRFDQAEAAHREALASTERRLRQECEAAKEECKRRGLRVNALEAELMTLQAQQQQQQQHQHEEAQHHHQQQHGKGQGEEVARQSRGVRFTVRPAAPATTEKAQLNLSPRSAAADKQAWDQIQTQKRAVQHAQQSGSAEKRRRTAGQTMEERWRAGAGLGGAAGCGAAGSAARVAAEEAAGAQQDGEGLVESRLCGRSGSEDAVIGGVPRPTEPVKGMLGQQQGRQGQQAGSQAQTQAGPSTSQWQSSKSGAAAGAPVFRQAQAQAGCDVDVNASLARPGLLGRVNDASASTKGPSFMGKVQAPHAGSSRQWQHTVLTSHNYAAAKQGSGSLRPGMQSSHFLQRPAPAVQPGSQPKIDSFFAKPPGQRR